MPIRPKTAMILAAGLGTRMRPLTDDRPKPLIEVCGKPLIDHAIERLKAAGVERIVVNLHYKGDMLRGHLESRGDVEILFSDETGELLDTGGGIRKALPLLGDEPIITHNADTLWVEGMGDSLGRLCAAWDEERMDALMLIASTATAIGYSGRGDFVMEADGSLQRREETAVAPFVWAGVQIIRPGLFADGPAGAFSTNLIWDRLIETGRLYGLRLDGTWLHVGTPEAVGEAEQFIADL